MDDESALADLLKKYLERLGYEVDVRASAEDALASFAEDPRRYALVLADLTLPGMNGEEMIGQMRGLNPDLRAIVSSGYAHQPRTKEVLFLQKPYIPRMLAEMIEKALDSPGSNAGVRF